MSHQPSDPFANLAAELLEFEEVRPDVFRAHCLYDNMTGAVFGGQFLAQALAAARKTVADWPAHTCTGYFMRPGALDHPIDYHVHNLRDGRTVAARRVEAVQNGKPIFEMLCSFHRPEPMEGGHQQDQRPDVPAPETLLSLADVVRANADRLPPAMRGFHERPNAIELRLCEPESLFFTQEQAKRTRDYWFRLPSAATVEGEGAHQCLIGMLSDYFFAGTPGALYKPKDQGFVPILTMTHSMWFHAPARADEWLLFQTDTPWAGNSRGLARGMIYDRAGTLVASAMQEVTIRFGQAGAGAGA